MKKVNRARVRRRRGKVGGTVEKQRKREKMGNYNLGELHSGVETRL
jgi:hypothetical protein